MRQFVVNVETPYRVVQARGILSACGRWIEKVHAPCRAAVISDDTVDALYGQTVEQGLREAGFAPFRWAFAHGEASKNLTTYSKILDFLCTAAITRADLVVALGGGVVGDTAGFAAATYLRGIPFVQVPTTVLAMVDSSVGGKTAVDLPAGKNLVGAFWQPALVLCDPQTLATLPQAVFTDGLAEAVKHAILADPALFTLLEAGQGLQGDSLDAMLMRNVEIKTSFVRVDEKDRGQRQLLNLGHTLGHAMEALSAFRLSHGQAVAVGTCAAAEVARTLGLCGEELPRRIRGCMAAVGLPTRVPYPARQIASAALGDKKRQGDVLHLVLPEAIGRCRLYPVPVEEVAPLLCRALEGSAP